MSVRRLLYAPAVSPVNLILYVFLGFLSRRDLAALGRNQKTPFSSLIVTTATTGGYIDLRRIFVKNLTMFEVSSIGHSFHHYGMWPMAFKYQQKNLNIHHFMALHSEDRKRKILVSGSRTRILAVDNCPYCGRWVKAKAAASHRGKPRVCRNNGPGAVPVSVTTEGWPPRPIGA